MTVDDIVKLLQQSRSFPDFKHKVLTAAGKLPKPPTPSVDPAPDAPQYIGTFDTVMRLESFLERSGYVRDLHGNWRRGNEVLSVEGSTINGFYVARQL